MSDSSGSSLNLSGRVALVTGANTGIGLVTARQLAAAGAQVFIACRSPERGREAVQALKRDSGSERIEVLTLDLGDLGSVRACAQDFLQRGLPLHLLINNAGVAGVRGLTASGFEMAFGTNHVGPFLLTQLLSERLERSAPARVVTVASRAHYRAPGIDWDAVRQPTRTTTGFPEYGVSKLANILFTAELGRRMKDSGVSTYALHPGVVASDIWRSVPWPLRGLIKLAMISTEEGAATSLYCATSAQAAIETGCYYDRCRLKEPSKVAQDSALAAELWRRSEAWVR